MKESRKKEIKEQTGLYITTAKEPQTKNRKANRKHYNKEFGVNRLSITACNIARIAAEILREWTRNRRRKRANA